MGHYIYSKHELVLSKIIFDELSKLEKLPTNCDIGSVAICTEDSSYYMLNTKKEWKKIETEKPFLFNKKKYFTETL